MNHSVTLYIILLLLNLSLLSIFSSAFAAEETEEITIYDLGKSKLQYGITSYRTNAALLDIQREYAKSRVGHHKNLMEISEKAYKTQQRLTVAIFPVVAVLVFGGFYLSFLQFKADATIRKDRAPGENQIKISKHGIEISSSVIGLIVLFMSFMFFHLYVKDVYSIKINQVSPVVFGSESGSKDVNTE